MATNDRPAAPEEKLYTRLQLARENGKEFDETKERAALGLTQPTGMAPLLIPESPSRTASTLRADASDNIAIDRIKAEAKGASEEDIRQENVRLKAELQMARATVATVTGTTPPPPTPQPAAPTNSPVANSNAFPPGAPNDQWTLNQLKEFNRASGLAPLERGGFGMSKIAVLNHVLGELAKPDEATDGGTTEGSTTGGAVTPEE